MNQKKPDEQTCEIFIAAARRELLKRSPNAAERTSDDEQYHDLRDGIIETAKELGQQGWETVNASMDRTEIASRGTTRGAIATIEYSIICFFKRPIG